MADETIQWDEHETIQWEMKIDDSMAKNHDSNDQ